MDIGCIESSGGTDDSVANWVHSFWKEKIVSWSFVHKVKPGIRTSVEFSIVVAKGFWFSIDPIWSRDLWGFPLNWRFLFCKVAQVMIVGAWSAATTIGGFCVIVGATTEEVSGLDVIVDHAILSLLLGNA
jgi:hypothetical protein